MSTAGAHHLAEELARAHLFVAELLERQAELRDLLAAAKEEIDALTDSRLSEIVALTVEVDDTEK